MQLVTLKSSMDNPRRMSHRHRPVQWYWWPDLLANKSWWPDLSKWVADGPDDQVSWVICCREVGKIQKRNTSQIRFSSSLDHEDRPKAGFRGRLHAFLQMFLKTRYSHGFLFRLQSSCLFYFIIEASVPIKVWRASTSFFSPPPPMGRNGASN